jgi:hypothetical protein
LKGSMVPRLTRVLVNFAHWGWSMKIRLGAQRHPEPGRNSTSQRDF